MRVTATVKSRCSLISSCSEHSSVLSLYRGTSHLRTTAVLHSTCFARFGRVPCVHTEHVASPSHHSGPNPRSLTISGARQGLHSNTTHRMGSLLTRLGLHCGTLVQEVRAQCEGGIPSVPTGAPSAERLVAWDGFYQTRAKPRVKVCKSSSCSSPDPPARPQLSTLTEQPSVMQIV